MSVTIYGISNCDTMKKARRCLEAHGVDCAFRDYRTEGIAGPVLDIGDRLLVGFKPEHHEQAVFSRG